MIRKEEGGEATFKMVSGLQRRTWEPTADLKSKKEWGNCSMLEERESSAEITACTAQGWTWAFPQPGMDGDPSSYSTEAKEYSRLKWAKGQHTQGFACLHKNLFCILVSEQVKSLKDFYTLEWHDMINTLKFKEWIIQDWDLGWKINDVMFIFQTFCNANVNYPSKWLLWMHSLKKPPPHIMQAGYKWATFLHTRYRAESRKGIMMTWARVRVSALK